MDRCYRLTPHNPSPVLAVVPLFNSWWKRWLLVNAHYSKAAFSPEWMAFRPCNRFRNSGDKRLYASVWEAKSVSPPETGPSSKYKNVVPGGCCSYVTSECQVTEFVRSSKKSLAVVSPAPRWTRWISGNPWGAPDVGWMWCRPKYPPKSSAS